MPGSSRSCRGLGSRSFKDRERASAYLLRRGLAAYPALLTASKADDPETRRRAEVIIDILKETLPEELFEIRAVAFFTPHREN